MQQGGGKVGVGSWTAVWSVDSSCSWLSFRHAQAYACMADAGAMRVNEAAVIYGEVG